MAVTRAGRKRRVAVLGLGSIGRRHARLLAQRPGVALELVDPSQEMLDLARSEVGQDLVSHLGFDDLMAAAPPDIVWIATPPPFHAPQAIRALEAGAHVFCEKPMSHTVGEAIAMREAALRSGRTFGVGFVLHFIPPIRRMKELLDSGQLGDLVHVQCKVGSYQTVGNSVSRYQAELEGSLFLDQAHQPDLLHWLTGRSPSSVYATGRQVPGLEHTSNPNLAVISCEYGDTPLLASITLNWVQAPDRHEYELVGTLGWVHLDLTTLTMTHGDRNSGTVETETFALEPDDIYRAEHEAFFDAVDGRRAPESTAEDGIASMRLLEAMIGSWRASAKVDIVAIDPAASRHPDGTPDTEHLATRQ